MPQGKAELFIYDENVKDTLKLLTRETREVWIADKPFAQGGCRQAFLCYFKEGAAWGPKKFVAKKYIREDGFLEDYVCSQMAATCAKAFNTKNPAKKVSYLVANKILSLNDENYSIEDFLEAQWQKHNDIFGNILSPKRTPDAFSHFTWEFSNKRFVILDVQGADEVYTDPAVVSVEVRKFGFTDTGLKGIRDFFSKHVCNEVCRMIGLTAVKSIPDMTWDHPPRPLCIANQKQPGPIPQPQLTPQVAMQQRSHKPPQSDNTKQQASYVYRTPTQVQTSAQLSQKASGYAWQTTGDKQATEVKTASNAASNGYQKLSNAKPYGAYPDAMQQPHVQPQLNHPHRIVSQNPTKSVGQQQVPPPPPPPPPPQPLAMPARYSPVPQFPNTAVDDGIDEEDEDDFLAEDEGDDGSPASQNVYHTSDAYNRPLPAPHEVDNMPIKELKMFLYQLDVGFDDCIERSDLCTRLQSALQGKLGGSSGDHERYRAYTVTTPQIYTAGFGSTSPRQSPVSPQSLGKTNQVDEEDPLQVPPCNAETISAGARLLWSKLNAVDLVPMKTMFLKYGSKGNPHRRYLYIKLLWEPETKEYNLYLVWQDVNGKAGEKTGGMVTKKHAAQRKVQLLTMKEVVTGVEFGKRFKDYLAGENKIYGRKGVLYDRNLCFSLKFPARTLDLLAMKQDDYNKWTRCLNLVCAFNKDFLKGSEGKGRFT